ncbi:hypothetical protein NUU61_002331 [Penicillium alfredii]|uniref:Cyanovirin-N domain-containing protein n=1 Tax=Penicillium alfredii TaxID=1506179 RepID=A0A9W9KFW2_9EURO|nr:uncharacterized protein NUU61_002331 [Penicillium alfredii]KAJ5104984.1 hypothetical protein NUU61_002331 [Penicillium alfredii]
MQFFQLVLLFPAIAAAQKCTWAWHNAPNDPKAQDSAGDFKLIRQCFGGDGQPDTVAELGMNSCLLNHNGSLEPGDNGGAFQSCQLPCGMGSEDDTSDADKATIKCNCGPKGDELSIPVTKAVTVSGAEFSCYTHTASTKTTEFPAPAASTSLVA